MFWRFIKRIYQSIIKCFTCYTSGPDDGSSIPPSDAPKYDAPRESVEVDPTANEDFDKNPRLTQRSLDQHIVATTISEDIRLNSESGAPTVDCDSQIGSLNSDPYNDSSIRHFWSLRRRR